MRRIGGGRSGGCGGGLGAGEAVASLKLEIDTLEPEHVQRDSSRRLAAAGRVTSSEV